MTCTQHKHTATFSIRCAHFQSILIWNFAGKRDINKTSLYPTNGQLHSPNCYRSIDILVIVPTKTIEKIHTECRQALCVAGNVEDGAKKCALMRAEFNCCPLVHDIDLQISEFLLRIALKYERRSEGRWTSATHVGDETPGAECRRGWATPWGYLDRRGITHGLFLHPGGSYRCSRGPVSRNQNGQQRRISIWETRAS